MLSSLRGYFYRGLIEMVLVVIQKEKVKRVDSNSKYFGVQINK